MSVEAAATWIRMLKDLALGSAAIATAIAAWKGVSTWRRELHGKADFEAARDLMRATYKVRDAMAACRANWIDISEFPPGWDGRPGSPVEAARANEYVFQKRWTPVFEAVLPFDNATSDAESLWGSTIRTKANELKRCMVELRAAIDAYIRNKASDGADFARDREYAERIQAAVFVGREDGQNALTTHIRDAVAGIEAEARPRMRRE